MIQLQSSTPPTWLPFVQDHLDSFLIDHAACERKAAATGIMFTVKFPDRPKVIEPMIRLAKEELQHYHEVYRIIQKRNLVAGPDERDPYVNALLKLARHGRDENFLDRLLIFGLVEARGHERFSILGEGLTDSELRPFYQKLAVAEDRHHQLFVDLALQFFPNEVVSARLDELSREEGKIADSLPLRAAVH